MRTIVKIRCCKLLLAMQLLAGCAKNPVGMYYSKDAKTLFRPLTILTENWDGKVVPCLRNVQCKLINPFIVRD